MIYYLSMKKVKIKYESHIFQEEHIDKYQEEILCNLEKKENETVISFLTNEKELTKFVFQERNILLYRENYTLKFNLDKIIECKVNTEYGSISYKTKLKKYLKLPSSFVINYELLMGKDSVGSYVIKISYEEVENND